METTSPEEDTAIEWNLRLPPLIRCSNDTCKEVINEGYKVDGRDFYLCRSCLHLSCMNPDIVKHAIHFSNKAGEIDPRYIRRASRGREPDKNGLWEVKIELNKYLKPHESCKRHKSTDPYYDKYDLITYMNDVGYHTVQLLLSSQQKKEGERTSVPSDTWKALKEVPRLFSGLVINIRPGVNIKINDSFVDARTTIEKQLDKDWEELYNKWKQNYPTTIKEFRKKIILHKREVNNLFYDEE